MNYLEVITINMSYDELIRIYTNLYDIIWSDVLPRGAVSLLQPVCVWFNTKHNMNEYELRWINYGLYEFVWYYREQRVTTGGRLAFTA